MADEIKQNALSDDKLDRNSCCCSSTSTNNNKPLIQSTIKSKIEISHDSFDIKYAQNQILEDQGYSVIKDIGSGTFASVKVAHSQKDNCLVAIKIISKRKAPFDYLTRFLPREIDVVKGLIHTNIVRYYRSIETTHRVFIFMEYAENDSLLMFIRRRDHLTEDCAKTIYQQLINVIEFCHNRGIVHRDIKCENLLFDKNYTLKLIDFGFARKNIDKKKSVLSDTYCGSHAYACPEILKGIPYEMHYADIWASGIVLYAMVYGTLPFDDTNLAHLCKQVNSRIKFPKAPSIDNMCQDLISKIIAPYKLSWPIELIQEHPWLLSKSEAAKNSIFNMCMNMDNATSSGQDTW